MSGELHATFAESSPGGTHALPLVAPPVAQPVAPPVAAPVALPVTRQRPGTVDTVAANDLPKPHRDRSRDHAQARHETTTSNTNFPAPASRKVTTNQHVLSILHVGSHHLQHRLSHATKPKSRHITNTLCPLTPSRHITNTFCPLTQLILEMRTAGGAACLLSAREVSLERQGNNERPRRQSRALFLRPMGVGCVLQIARATLSDFRHLVHTFRRLGVPLTRARTRWMFGFHRRLVRTCECDTLLPKPGPLPHTSQTAATMFSSVCLPVQSLAPHGRGETHPSVLEPKATMTE